MGSLAGAAHLLNNNTGVLSVAQTEQKSVVDDKTKSCLDCIPSVWVSARKLWFNDPSVLSDIDAGGVRKVTTGITGLWRISVHSDFAF